MPYFGNGDVLLFSRPVVIAGLLVPALAAAGFALAHRWRYGPFFLLLALAGLVAMVAGFPEGTPLRRAMNFTYNHLSPVQVLRTTYKAGPLLALGLACLAGGAAARLPGRWRPAAAAGLAVLAAVAAWPLVTRPRDRPAADVRRGARVVARGRPPRRRDGGGGRARRRAAGPAVRVLPLGRHDRRDPARARRAPRGGPLRGALRRPARRRPALDHGRARPAAARAARPARPAAGPAQRAHGRRGAPTTTAGCSGAVPPGEAADVLAQLGPPDERWGAVRPERRARARSAARCALPRVRAWDRAGAPGTGAAGARRRRDGARRQRRRARRAWRRSGRCRATGGSPTRATCRTPSCGAPPAAARS